MVYWGRAHGRDQFGGAGEWCTASLRPRGPDGTKTRIDELVPFTYTVTMFGGRRQWFMCLKCGRRAAGYLEDAISMPTMLWSRIRLHEPPHQPAIDRAVRLRKRVVVVALLMEKTFRRNRRACAGEPIGRLHQCVLWQRFARWLEARDVPQQARTCQMLGRPARTHPARHFRHPLGSARSSKPN
jgi:hypothetical protein